MTNIGTDEQTPKVADRRSSRLRLLVIGGAVVLLDQLTKYWATVALDDGPIDVVWTLRLNKIGNTGAAWSKGEGFGPILGILILGIIAAMYLFRDRITQGWSFVAYAAIFGGAIGNALDRMFRDEGWLRGAVIDFIDFQWYPVFNIADMAVVLGGVSLLGLSWYAQANETSATPAEADPSTREPTP